MAHDPQSLYLHLLHNVWTTDLADVHAAAAGIVTADFVIHQARLDGQDSTATRGPQALADMITAGRRHFDDVTVTCDVPPLVDEGRVAGKWTFRGTYNGTIPQATASVGTPVSFGGIDILTLQNGRFVEYWVCSDGVDFMTQLGLL